MHNQKPNPFDRFAWILDLEEDEAQPTDDWAPERIAQALREGTHFNDRAFDRHMPSEVQAVSRRFWTPLYIARRAADWLKPLGVRSIVDIGSGAGKFGVAAAIAGDFQVTGLEQRLRLVSAARSLACTFGVEDKVTFIQGDFESAPLPQADAYYLYNPFGENLFGPDDHLDADVELSHARFERDVSYVESLLRQAPKGTYVLTYNGFGGVLPKTYREVQLDNRMPNTLQLSQKVDDTRASRLAL